MPLLHSASPAAFKENIRTLYGEIGKSPHVKNMQQALAISYATQRRAAQGKAAGGVAGYQMGGAAPLMSGRLATRMIGPGVGTPMRPNPTMQGRPMPTMGGVPAQMPPVGAPGMGAPPGRRSGGVRGYQVGGSPTAPWWQSGGATLPIGGATNWMPGGGSMPTMPGGTASPGVSATPPPMPIGGMPGGATTPPVGTNPAIGRQAGGSAEMGDQATEVETGESGSVIPPMGMTPGPGPPQGSPMPGGMGGMKMGRAWGGPINMAKGPDLMPPSPMDRFESRQMMHGPVIGSTPGRADSRNAQVESGAYILPAHHVASMGDGNTLAGLKAANNRFGVQGPYGAGMPKVTHGAGPPKPSMPSMKGMGVAPAPKVPKIAISGALSGYGGAGGGGGGGNGGMGMSSEGGGRGFDDNAGRPGRPVPVKLSDGEYSIHPLVVRNISLMHGGIGDLKHGHRLLDAYVMHARKKEIEKLKGLPPPAKRMAGGRILGRVVP